ncbi:MBL fold metallo-hydrolase [Nocardioides campestrisoli]|uniref:MBL fold metallo-hydrolase n=1 Tax=Nocardioides campestrisoli TaxID=2736757 RepID=UPI0015E6862A|nr:MBL fold metallo-hydrolase [Nocardioides campestrisoli]
MTQLVEVADRVWVARYAAYDVNVTVLGGERGLVVVDSRESVEAGRELAADVAALGRGEVVAVVNTHDHVDHVGGNTALGAPEVVAHEDADVPTATRTFSSVSTLDLGDRVVELFHPGRAHTAGDLVVRVPDADLLVVGDLVEEATPPWYGADSWPLDWPIALDMVLGLASGSTVVVPGHGIPVDRDFVEQQRGDVGIVAETLRDLAGRGVPRAEALAAASWPFPPEHIAEGVARAYDQLPQARRTLPLV